MRIELAVGAALLAVMACVSWYGFATLPSDARVPIHYGPAGIRYASKRAGLLMHVAAGAVLFVVLVGLSSGRASTRPGAIAVPIVMAVLLIVQAGSIWMARRNSG
jgi:heme A synthase